MPATLPPLKPGGSFDLDLSDPTKRAVAYDVILAASYRTGCTLTELEYFESFEGGGRTQSGGGSGGAVAGEANFADTGRR